MKLLKIQLLALALFATSCNSWDWEPRPYVFNVEESSIVGYDNSVVYFDQPEIEQYLCFHEDNIAELAAEIAKIKKRKYREKANRELNKLLKR